MEIAPENQDEQARAYGRVIAKAWSDEAFKQRLLVEPVAALRDEGVDVADGIEVRVVENSEDVVYLALPPRPTELTDEQLEAVAGGQYAYGYGGYHGGGGHSGGSGGRYRGVPPS